VELGALPERDEPPLLVGEGRRLRAAGWSPRLTLREGLLRTIDHHRALLALAAS
jgi:hypothetical protein